MEAELQDISSQESKDEASLAKVKKQLRDLEAKVKDQEEELDEQAGSIQMLEQAKLRLEMEMERMRQTHSKEMESRDEEVEEARQSCQKKVRIPAPSRLAYRPVLSHRFTERGRVFLP